MGAPITDRDLKPRISFAGEGIPLPTSLRVTTFIANGEKDVKTIMQTGFNLKEIAGGQFIEDPILAITLGPTRNETSTDKVVLFPTIYAHGSDIKAEKKQYDALCAAISKGQSRWPYPADQIAVDVRWAQVLSALPAETHVPTPSA